MNLKEMQSDYSWRNAFQFAFDDCEAPYKGHCAIHLVETILASSEGENEGAHWIAVAKLFDGRYVVISSGCDYTGWDCQAGGDAEFYDTADAACSKLALTDEMRERLGPQLAMLAQRGEVRLDWEDEG